MSLISSCRHVFESTARGPMLYRLRRCQGVAVAEDLDMPPGEPEEPFRPFSSYPVVQLEGAGGSGGAISE